MRIGLAIENFDPRRGGAEYWTHQFAQALSARGHEVHVAAQSFAPAALRGPLVCHPLPSARSRLQFGADAERVLRPLNLDVVHDMGAGWYGNVFSSHDGSRHAQWHHKLAMLPAWLRPMKRWLLRLMPRYREFSRLMDRQFADPGRRLIAMSQMVADDYQQWHGVRPEQIRLVYHGVDSDRFSPQHTADLRSETRRRLGLRPDETTFVFVGHDFARKGLSTVLRAMGRLRRQGATVRLLVLGRDRRRPLYAWRARRCGVADEVAFLAAQNDPRPFYAAADAAVLPTFYDPFGLVVLEAAACGLPVICSARAGASELLDHGREGYVLDDPADDHGLAEQMLALCDVERREAMGRAARQLALRHTFERNCEETLAVYRELLDCRRAAA